MGQIWAQHPQNHQNLKWDGYGWFTTKNGPTSVSGPLDLKYWHILTNSQMLHVHLGSWCPVSSRPSQGCACWWPTGGTWVSSQANQQNHAAAKHCELLDDIYCMYYIYIRIYIYTYIYILIYTYIILLYIGVQRYVYCYDFDDYYYYKLLSIFIYYELLIIIIVIILVIIILRGKSAAD